MGTHITNNYYYYGLSKEEVEKLKKYYQKVIDKAKGENKNLKKEIDNYEREIKFLEQNIKSLEYNYQSEIKAHKDYIDEIENENQGFREKLEKKKLEKHKNY